MKQLVAPTGGSIAYLVERAAPEIAVRGEPVLLIHGFASSHAVNWVFPQWVKTLTAAGRDVVLYDLRGHGRSHKFYRPEDYAMSAFCSDALALLDHLGLERVDVMGYSLGARIAAFLQRLRPDRIRSLVFGGLGLSLVEGIVLPSGIGDAMDAPTLESLTDPHQRMFRAFADATRSDRRALAACIRGARQLMPAEQVSKIACPVLVAVGTQDDIAGDAGALAKLIPNAQSFAMQGLDHNRAVGDRFFKAAVLQFLAERA